MLMIGIAYFLSFYKKVSLDQAKSNVYLKIKISRKFIVNNLALHTWLTI